MGTCPSYAGEIDLLLNKLVEKGILTAGEAQELKTETQEQAKAEISQGKSATLPAWIQNTKLKGDFRLRYQMDKNINSTRDARHQGRVRLRLGLESKVNDKLNVGVGLATGTNDATTINKDQARSTNQSFSNSFSKHPVSFDYYYAQYMPAPYATIYGGKFKNALWEPGDLIWDTDINPEGGALLLTKKLNPETDLFMNSGVYVLNEVSSSDNDDPVMYFVQPGMNLNLTDKISLKGAVAFNVTTNVKGRPISAAAGSGLPGTTSTSTAGNTQGAGTVYKYAYNYINPAGELTFRQPLKSLNIPLLDFPAISFFGEYVNNPQVSKGNTGFMAGVKIGAEKISAWGDWQLAYNYAMLGKDAVLDILPDSDRFGGQTDIRAHESILQYGLGKNTYLSLDYYQARRIHQSSSTPATHVVQVDWNLKF